MRLDLFLKKTCIVKSRAAAKAVCDAGAAAVNGHVAKAAQELRAGDVVRLRFVQRLVELRVLGLPHGNVAKRDAALYVAMLRDVALAPAEHVFGEPAPAVEGGAAGGAGGTGGAGGAGAATDRHGEPRRRPRSSR